jgi:hypothetical protein
MAWYETGEIQYVVFLASSVGLALYAALSWLSSYNDGIFLPWVGTLLGLAWDLGWLWYIWQAEKRDEVARYRERFNLSFEWENLLPAIIALLRLIWLHFEHGAGSSLWDCTHSLNGAFALANASSTSRERGREVVMSPRYV